MQVYKGKLVNYQLYALIRYLQAPGGKTASALVSLMDVSRASVYRYLRALEEMGFPLTSESRGREVYYFFDMNDSHVARNIFDNLTFLKEDFYFDRDEKLLIEFLFTNAERSVPILGERINGLHRKMQTLLSFAGHVADTERDDIVSPDKSSISVVHSFLDMPKRSESDRKEIISLLCDAVRRHTVCRVVYRASEEMGEEYDIMPLSVFSWYGGTYTVVETRDHESSSKLEVGRIESLTPLKEHFARRTGFDLEYTLCDPFGLDREEPFEIEVLLDERNAKSLMECQWPQGRVTFSKPDSDGWVHFRCVTRGEKEVLRWLRYMGNGARLISPQWLLGKLKWTIGAMAARYGYRCSGE